MKAKARVSARDFWAALSDLTLLYFAEHFGYGKTTKGRIYAALQRQAKVNELGVEVVLCVPPLGMTLSMARKQAEKLTNNVKAFVLEHSNRDPRVMLIFTQPKLHSLDGDIDNQIGHKALLNVAFRAKPVDKPKADG